MKYRSFVWLALFGTASLPAAQIDYATLVASAVEHSHRLLIRSIDTRIEEAKRDGLYSVFYPQISLGYNAEYNRNLDPAASGSLMVGDMMINSSVPYKHSGVARMNYELYRFGATMKQIESAEKGIAAKRLETCVEETRLRSDILDRYADALRSQSEREHKERLCDARRSLYGLKQRLYDAGKESRISVGEEAIRILDLERDIERARMAFEENVISLSNLSHVEMGSNETRFSPLGASSAVDEPLLSFFRTPNARMYEERLSQKESEIEALSRSQLPVVSLYSSYYLYGTDPHDFAAGFEAIRPNSWNAGISLRWSLFEGFKYDAESARLKLERDRIRAEAELSKREFDHEARRSKEKINRLAALSSNDERAIDETAARLAMTQRLREQGEADALAVANLQIERIEREMTLESETIQKSYEAEKLRLQHRGVDACTPR